MTFTRKIPRVPQDQLKLGSSGIKRKSSELTLSPSSTQKLPGKVDSKLANDILPEPTQHSIKLNHSKYTIEPETLSAQFIADENCPPMMPNVPPRTKRRRFSSASAADPLMRHAFSGTVTDEEEPAVSLFSSVPVSHKSQRSRQIPIAYGSQQRYNNNNKLSSTEDILPPSLLAPNSHSLQPQRVINRKKTTHIQSNCAHTQSNSTHLQSNKIGVRGRCTNERETHGGFKSQRARPSIETIVLTFPSPRKPPKKKKEIQHNEPPPPVGDNPQEAHSDSTPPFFSPGCHRQVDDDERGEEGSNLLSQSVWKEPLVGRKSLGRNKRNRIQPSSRLNVSEENDAGSNQELFVKPSGCQSAYCSRCLRKMLDERELFGSVVTASKRIPFPAFSQAAKLVNNSSVSEALDTTTQLLSPSNITRYSPDYKHNSAHSSTCGNVIFKNGRLTPLNRARLINFMVHCQSKLPHPPSPFTLHVGISCFDRFCTVAFNRGDKTSKDKVVKNISAVAIASLHLASKVEDVWAIEIADLVVAAAGAFTIKEILIWERRLLHALDFRISTPTSLDFALSFLSQSTFFEHQCCGRTNGKVAAREVPGQISDLDCHQGLEQPDSKDCSCNVCNVCGELAKEQQTSPPCDDLQRLNDNSGPVTNTDKTSIETATIFLIEFFLTHPSSVDFTYELIAAAVLYIVLNILFAKSSHLVFLIAPECTRLLLDANKLDALPAQLPLILAAIVCAYEEYLKVEELSKDHCKEEALALMETYITDHVSNRNASDAPTLFEEAFEESDEKVRETKLAAYLIQAAYNDGHSLSVATAKDAVRTWNNEKIIGPHGLVTEKQPPEPPHQDWKELYPLGLFAADVVAKHKDTANLFHIRFKEWKLAEADLFSNLLHLGSDCDSKDLLNHQRNHFSQNQSPQNQRLNETSVVAAEIDVFTPISTTRKLKSRTSLPLPQNSGEVRAKLSPIGRQRRRSLPARSTRRKRYCNVRNRSSTRQDTVAAAQMKKNSGRGRPSYITTRKVRWEVSSATSSPNIKSFPLIEQPIAKSVGAGSNSSVSTSAPLLETPTIDFWNNS